MLRPILAKRYRILSGCCTSEFNFFMVLGREIIECRKGFGEIEQEWPSKFWGKDEDDFLSQ